MGIKINKEVLAILLFADDIVLMAETAEELQSMLNEVTRYSEEMEVKFSNEKSQIMIINRDEEVEERWFLNNREMEIINKYNYLGIQFQNTGLLKEKNEKINKAEQWYGRLGSSLGFRANTYEIMRGMWKGVAVPSIMYGMEILTMTRTEIRSIETTQNKVARLGLGANKWVATEALNFF